MENFYNNEVNQQFNLTEKDKAMVYGDYQAKNYEQHLDNMFNASTETSGREQPDVTGLIGQYAHGNDPSHHMAYLYNYIGAPHKTQKIVRQIMDEQYTSLPNGLSGNEDCGQMSAWYVLSAMGFYSVTPGLDYYAIGTPIIEKATLSLENGNKFTINLRYTTYLNLENFDVEKPFSKNNTKNLNTLRGRNLKEAQKKDISFNFSNDFDKLISCHIDNLLSQGKKLKDEQKDRKEIRNIIKNLEKQDKLLLQETYENNKSKYIICFGLDNSTSFFLFGAPSDKNTGNYIGTASLWNLFKKCKEILLLQKNHKKI